MLKVPLKQMPGEIIISHKKGKTSTDVNAYCASFTLDELPESPQTHLATISAASWAFDGTFERRHVELFISRLTSTSDDGEFDITDLSVYPMEFASRETIEALRRRGRMFWKCRHRNYVQYTGAIDDGMQVSVCTHLLDLMVRANSEQAESRFMIDMVTYKQMHPEARRSEENSSRMLEPLIMFQDDPDLGDDFFMCLPSTIRGFNMRTKHWGKTPSSPLRSEELQLTNLLLRNAGSRPHQGCSLEYGSVQFFGHRAYGKDTGSGCRY